MQLYKIAVATIFGRGTRFPFRVGLLRLIMLMISSVILGTILATIIAPLPNFAVQNSVLIGAIGIVVIHITVLCALIASMGVLRGSSHENLVKLLVVLPVTAPRQLAVLLVPSCMLVLLTLGLVGIPYVYIMDSFGVHWAIYTVGGLLGAGAGLSIVCGIVRRFLIAQVGYLIASLGAQYFLLRQIAQAAVQNRDFVLFVLLLLSTLLIPVVLLWYMRTHIVSDIAQPRQSRSIRTHFLPSYYWFFKKLVRSPITRLGLATSLAVASGIALLCLRLDIRDTSIISVTVALMSAGFTSDIRMLSRKYAPVEVAGLRGIFRFLTIEAGTGLPFAFLAVSPLLFLGAIGSDMSGTGTQIIELTRNIMIGACAGLGAGTLFAPMHRDISAQCVAVLVATGITILPLANPINIGAHREWLFQAGVITIFLTVACLTEYKRNPYIWRKHA